MWADRTRPSGPASGTERSLPAFGAAKYSRPRISFTCWRTWTRRRRKSMFSTDRPNSSDCRRPRSHPERRSPDTAGKRGPHGPALAGVHGTTGRLTGFGSFAPRTGSGGSGRPAPRRPAPTTAARTRSGPSWEPASGPSPTPGPPTGARPARPASCRPGPGRRGPAAGPRRCHRSPCRAPAWPATRRRTCAALPSPRRDRCRYRGPCRPRPGPEPLGVGPALEGLAAFLPSGSRYLTRHRRPRSVTRVRALAPSAPVDHQRSST